MGLDVLDNPIIGHVESVPYDLEHKPWFIRNSHPGVGYQCDTEPQPIGDAIHLLLNRTGISIYENV